MPTPPSRLHRWLFPWRLWLAGLLFVLPAALFVICLPGRGRRRRMARWAARHLFRLAGLPLTVMGLEHLPEAPCILASNHASYLDGVLLTAALPPRFGFVIKREAARTPVIGWLLGRLGSEFVERFDTKAAKNDAHRLIHLARRGVSFGVFPEGTFRREPGLRTFHLGGFLAATRAGVPVVPIVIRGARAVLPADTLWPRAGWVEVEILPPVAPQGRNGEGARELCQAVRNAILAHSEAAERQSAQAQHGVPAATAGRNRISVEN